MHIRLIAVSLAASGFVLGAGGCSDTGMADAFNPPDIDRTGDRVVATVDGTSVYLSDVAKLAVGQGRVESADMFTPESEAFAEVRGEVVDQRLASLEARRRGLDTSEEALRRLAIAEERILANLLLERHLADLVTETELGRLYDEQAALREPVLQVRGRHLVVETEAEAKAARKRVEDGEDFADVAADVSLDTATAAEGGALDWFTQTSYEDAFTQAAFATVEGAMSPPVETDEGWHVILVEGTREDAPPTFEELRDELEAFLTYDTVEAYVNELRAGADVEIVQ